MRKADTAWWTTGTFESRPMPEILKARDIGAVFRFLRSRGWSRVVIAGAAGLSETRVRAIAQGNQQITSYEVLERIAEGLTIERGLLGLAFTSANQMTAPDPASAPLQPSGSLNLPVSGLDSIRAVLDIADLPPDGPIRPLPELATAVTDVVRLRLASNYTRLCVALPDLLNELHRAHEAWAGQRRAAVAALLTQAYRAADALADKSGHHDLSARIIAMMAQSARRSGDELVLATASYVRGELFFANGRPDLGRTVLERAAERLLPGSDTDTSAAYGSLHMRAAVLAGQSGRLDQARDHLAEAAEYATQVPEGEYHGTAFGPSSVRIHEVTLAVDTGDPDNALRVAADWDPPEELPAERRSHFYIDLARSRAMLDSPDDAVTALFQARAVAPEHTRFHPQVRRLVSDLLDGAGSTSRVHDFARWTAVPAAVS